MRIEVGRFIGAVESKGATMGMMLQVVDVKKALAGSGAISMSIRVRADVRHESCGAWPRAEDDKCRRWGDEALRMSQG